MTQENKNQEQKVVSPDNAERADMYTDDRDVVTNHLKQSAARLMKARFAGAAKMAMSCLEMAATLDELVTTPKPEPKKRKK